MAACKLCLQVRPLCDSHVVPEFDYKPLYDAKHRAMQLEVERAGARFLQKGYREPLLCEECEGRLSVFERYAARWWRDQLPELQR